MGCGLGTAVISEDSSVGTETLIETSERKSNIRHEIQSLGTKFKPMFQARMFQCFAQCFTNVSAKTPVIQGFLGF